VREVEGRTARKAARTKYMKREKKRGSRKASQATPTHSVRSNFAHTNCVRFNFARTNGRFKWRDGHKAGTSYLGWMRDKGETSTKTTHRTMNISDSSERIM